MGSARTADIRQVFCFGASPGLHLYRTELSVGNYGLWLVHVGILLRGLCTILVCGLDFAGAFAAPRTS